MSDDDDDPEIEDEVLENALHRLNRTVLRGDEALAADLVDEFVKPANRGRPVRERLAADLAVYDAGLIAAGLPLPHLWVAMRGDQAHQLPEDWCDRLRAEHGQHVEVLQSDAEMRIETGRNFVLRRVEPFSYHYWLSRLSDLIRLIIQIEDGHDRDDLAARNTLEQLLVVYGTERGRFLVSHLHLRKIEWSDARMRNIEESGKQRHAASRDWRERARMRARQTWEEHPDRRITTVARIIRIEFDKEERRVRREIEDQVGPAWRGTAEVEMRVRGELRARAMLTANHGLPAIRSIRREIELLDPKKKPG